MRYKIIILAIAITLVASSCVMTRKAWERRYLTVDSTGIETKVYRDTIMPVFIKGSPLVSNFGVIKDKLVPTIVTVRSGTARARVEVRNDTIFVQAFQADSLYYHKFDSLLVENNTLRTKVVKVEKQRNGVVLGSSGLMLLILLIFVLVIKK